MKLDNADIDALIVDELYHNFPGTALTVCALVLKNGYIATGESAPIDPANFDVELGRESARTVARNKIWALEGYARKTALAASKG